MECRHCSPLYHSSKRPGIIIPETYDHYACYYDDTPPQLSQPAYAVYVNTLNQWWGDVVAAEIGATNPRGYNTILLAFWIPKQDGTSNPVDAAVV